MSREQNSNGSMLGVQIEGVLRHADGSPDIAAYAKLAHHERAAAIAVSAREGVRRIRNMWSMIGTNLAPSKGPNRLPESITPLHGDKPPAAMTT